MPPDVAPAALELPLQYDAVEHTDVELADELYEATAVLSMGSAEGIGAETARDLRERRLAAARELMKRWSAPQS